MNILSKITNIVKLYQKEIFLGFCIILISVISFNVGRINALHKTPIKITGEANVYQATIGGSVLSNKKSAPVLPKDPRVVASKASSSKKYHYSWCSSGKRITQKNQLWFANESTAQKAGYTLAGNCQ